MKKIENHSLYHYGSCSFCFSVRMTMTRLGVEMELRNIHQGNEHVDALRKGGGSTTVPCLRIDEDGETRWMYESADIITYLKMKFSIEAP